MSVQSILEKYYSQTRISDGARQKLSTFSVSDVISYHFTFIKQNFKRGFLFPFLWYLLIQFGIAFLLFAVIFLLMLFLTNPNSDLVIDLDSGEVSAWRALELFSYFFLGALVVAVPAALLTYYVRLRHFNLLNNQQLTSLWQSQKPLAKPFWQAVLGQLIIFLIRLPLWVLASFVIFFSVANFANYSAQRNGSMDQVPEIFAMFGSNIFLAFLVAFVGIALVIVLDMVIAGFVGLFDQLVIHEDQSAWLALKKSFQISKLHYFLNVLRWFLFILIVMGISTAFSVINQVVTLVLQFVGVLVAAGSEVQAIFGIFLILIVVVSLAISIVQSFILYSLEISFSYLTFYNFRASTLKQVEGEKDIEDVE